MSNILNTSRGVVARGSTTVTIPIGFTPTAGSLLMVVVASAAALTITTAGWSRHLGILSDLDHAILTKTADGSETQLVLTQTTSRSVIYTVIELRAGGTLTAGTTAPPAAISGMPSGGGDNTLFNMVAKMTNSMTPTGTVVWAGTPTPTEISDHIATPVTSADDGMFQTIAATETTGTTANPSYTHDTGPTGLSSHYTFTIGYYSPFVASNVPPVARAGSDQSVAIGATVTLNAGTSTDSDGTIVGYSWAQLSGPAVTLSGTGASRTFIAGTVGTQVFEVTVTDDDGATHTDTVSIVTAAGNLPPAASAGPDQTVNVGAPVTLNAGGSTDSDGTIASYAWAQTSGTTVTLAGSGATRTFTPATIGSRTFQVTVTDDDGATATDSVTVTVVNPTSNYGASVALENALAGAPQNLWWQGLSSLGLKSFPRKTYFQPGATAQFSVDCASAFTTTIFRLGHYAGDGAREVQAAYASTPATQPAPVAISGGNGAVTCAAWSANATWAIPSDALPGWYMAVFRRGSDSVHGYALFLVSDAAAKRSSLIVTGDATWHAAYNGFGGNNVYGASEGIGSIGARAFCSTYDKPVISHDNVPQTHFFNNTYPYLSWSERMGYEAGVATIEQIKDDPTILDGRDLIIWAGHNEYVPQQVMDKTKSLLAAGQNMVNIAGNDFFWRVKFTDGAFSSAATGRNMWCKKDTMSGPSSGPNATPGHIAGTPFTTSADWTGTWQDNRWTLREPSEDFFGDQFIANGIRADAVQVPASMKALPPWRNCPGIQALTAGQSYAFVAGTLGMEWDRPMLANANVEQILFSSSEVDLAGASDSNGETYSNTLNDVVHGFAMVQSGSGYVANFNSDQWGWALSPLHLRGSAPANVNAMQMMLNVISDLGVQPSSSSVTAAGLSNPTPVAMTAYGFDAPVDPPPAGNNPTWDELIAEGYTPYFTTIL